jgi:phosphohistidine phosphatase
MPERYELYLIRHAIAEPRGDAWPDDTKRPLTDDGMTRMRRAARGLVRLGVEFEVMLTSPLVRTRQTAEIVASAFDVRPPIVAAESLQPGGSFQLVVADLEKQARRRRIALVGHEPSLGELAARLSGSRRPLRFKKGAICRIDIENLQAADAGSLRWFVTPGFLRMIQK